MTYLEAVDIVCMECHYLSEETCSECPIRKTTDEKNGESTRKETE